MPPTIFTGSFADLEVRFTDAVRDLQRHDPLAPVPILVGSNVLAVYLRRRLALGGKCAGNLRFRTFLDLAAQLGAGFDSPNPLARLSRLGGVVVLDEILDESVPEGFREMAGFQGFRAALAATFRDLRDAGVTPEVLEASLEALVQDRPDRAGHLRGLAQLYRRARERLAAFHDVDDDFRRAIAGARRAPELLGSPALLVYGIYDVTGQQRDLLDRLGERLEMVYFIPYVHDACSRFALDFLESRTRVLGVSAQPAGSVASGPSLHSLAERIFREDAGAGGALPDDGSFALLSVPGESRAAVEIVREILTAVRDGVIAGFHEAAVILRHPEEELPLVTEAMRLRAIPYYIHGGSPFSDRPLARAVMAVLALESQDFSRHSVLTAMELVGASLPPESAGNWDAPRWRAVANDARFLGGMESWERGTSALIAELGRELERAEAAGQESDEGEEKGTGRSVELARRRLDAARSLRDAWTVLRFAAGEWPAALSWDEWGDLLETRLEPLLGQSEDWQGLAGAIDEVRRLDSAGSDASDRPIARSRMEEVTAAALHGLAYREGDFQRRGIHLLSTAAARGLRFPLVILPGLDEGRFPARLRQDPLLLDAERRVIGRPPRLPIRALRRDEEILLFAMAARSAEHRLVLITSRLDEGADRETIPSDFFLRAAAAARGSAVGLRDLAGGAIPGFRSVGLEHPAPAPHLQAVDQGEIRLRAVIQSRPSSILDALSALDAVPVRESQEYDRSRFQKNLTRYDGRIFDSALLRWLRETIGPAAGQVSASRLEMFAQCPYRFFLRRAMQLEKWEEPEASMGSDPLERGRAVHSILERFAGESRGDSWFREPESELWARLEAVARQELGRSRPAGIPDLLWEIECDDLLRLLRRWLSFERERAAEGLQPCGFEV
ncbi:MAG: hypothetical protein FJW35_06490, partial [Acidobacteria bacterium]|nr:hypothetical protein [Acidobacteriota bacterium]